jgi:hypothetical protein
MTEHTHPTLILYKQVRLFIWAMPIFRFWMYGIVKAGDVFGLRFSDYQMEIDQPEKRFVL